MISENKVCLKRKNKFSRWDKKNKTGTRNRVLELKPQSSRGRASSNSKPRMSRHVIYIVIIGVTLGYIKYMNNKAETGTAYHEQLEMHLLDGKSIEDFKIEYFKDEFS